MTKEALGEGKTNVFQEKSKPTSSEIQQGNGVT